MLPLFCSVSNLGIIQLTLSKVSIMSSPNSPDSFVDRTQRRFWSTPTALASITASKTPKLGVASCSALLRLWLQMVSLQSAGLSLSGLKSNILLARHNLRRVTEPSYVPSLERFNSEPSMEKAGPVSSLPLIRNMLSTARQTGCEAGSAMAGSLPRRHRSKPRLLDASFRGS